MFAKYYLFNVKCLLIQDSLITATFNLEIECVDKPCVRGNHLFNILTQKFRLGLMKKLVGAKQRTISSRRLTKKHVTQQQVLTEWRK